MPQPQTTPVIQAIFPSQIDSTQLSCLDSCYQRYFREFILGLVPYGKSPDLHAGGALARGLEITRYSLWVDKESLEIALLRGSWAIIDFWGDYEPPLKRGKPHVKSLINTVEALHSYFNEYPPDRDQSSLTTTTTVNPPSSSHLPYRWRSCTRSLTNQ